MSGKCLVKFLRGRDLMGHPIQVSYKGEETHNSVIGGLLSLGVQVMTFIMFVTALDEAINMKDPQIISYEYPLSRADRTALLPVRLADYDFVMALEYEVKSKKDKDAKVDIPIELG